MKPFEAATAAAERKSLYHEKASKERSLIVKRCFNNVIVFIRKLDKIQHRNRFTFIGIVIVINDTHFKKLNINFNCCQLFSCLFFFFNENARAISFSLANVLWW